MSMPQQLTVLPASGTAEKLKRVLCTVLVFTLLGPIVAGITIYCVNSVVQFGSSFQEFSLVLLFNVVFISLVGGAPLALSIGAIVAVWEWAWRPTFVAAVAAAVIASIVYYFVMRVLQPPFIFFFAMHGLTPQSLAVLLPISVMVSMICWLLTTRLCGSAK